MRQIILASGSPRRRELLEQMGLQFTVIPSDFEEWLDDTRDPAEMAKELALGKARDVARRYPEALVIGSDTVAMLDGRQLGKQPDEAAARKLLREMSGAIQEIVTSVALVCQATGLAEVRADRAVIVFEAYGEAEIDRYLQYGAWQDKAAATAIQDEFTVPVAYIEGDYDTILGLSTRLVAEMLRAQGIDAQPAKPRLPKTVKYA